MLKKKTIKKATIKVARANTRTSQIQSGIKTNRKTISISIQLEFQH